LVDQSSYLLVAYWASKPEGMDLDDSVDRKCQDTLLNHY